MLALGCREGLLEPDKAQWDWELSDLVKKPLGKLELREVDDTGEHRSGTVYYKPNLPLVKEVSITLDDSADKSVTFKGGIGATYGIGFKDGKLLIAGLVPIKREDSAK